MKNINNKSPKSEPWGIPETAVYPGDYKDTKQNTVCIFSETKTMQLIQ